MNLSKLTCIALAASALSTAAWADSVADAVQGADAIITMLPDSPDVEAVALRRALPDELDALPALLEQAGFPVSGLLATHGDCHRVELVRREQGELPPRQVNVRRRHEPDRAGLAQLETERIQRM